MELHPVRATWREPERLFAGAVSRHPDLFWLDAGADATAGWSWLGVGQPAELDDVRAVTCTAEEFGDSGPFRGGWVGWLAYEDGARRAGAPVAEGDGIRSRWMRAERFVAFDHAARGMWLFAADPAAFERELAEWETAPLVSRPPQRTARARHEPDEYARLVEECRSAIREGDAYQLCLTTRFEVDGPVDEVGAYLALRRATPAHHGGFVRIEGVTLASASPERFLEIAPDAAGAVVRTHPIKGTRPRGADAASDRALRAELQASPKERAENVMIVDLMRNDLSRVTQTGTVTVERLLELESYPAVHQLVSAVAGRLTSGVTIGDVWDAAFPAGSMTGAPKLSAMTILHRLEGGPRGVFAGCFGWVGQDGGMDAAMVIRSIVVHRGGAYVGAGGGITWLSVAAEEVAEVGVKARAPLAALGSQLPPGW